MAERDFGVRFRRKKPIKMYYYEKIYSYFSIVYHYKPTIYPLIAN